jgi:gamma-glutamyltranspeptidase/glutathione hydrolase
VGVVLNDQMDDFSAAPGVPNSYGLVGGEANAVQAGKRPLSSMTPTVLRGPDGQVLVIGASGGSTIISGVLQAIVAIVDLGMTPAEAVALPRVHHQWLPKVLMVEPEIGPETRAALEALGHTVKVARSFTSVQAALRSADGVVLGGSDPRKGGRPASIPE